MNVYDVIKEYDEEQMIKFLKAFANDTITQFANNIFPSEENIRAFLEKEVPEQ